MSDKEAAVSVSRQASKQTNKIQPGRRPRQKKIQLASIASSWKQFETLSRVREAFPCKAP